MKRLFFASLFCGILLLPTLLAVETTEVPAKAKRILANEGTLIYDLPKNAEVTLRWKQFNGNDQETHCTAVLPDKKEWTNLHLVDSRGEGQWGTGGFSCLRLAKTPPEEVRVSFRNLGEDAEISLQAQNRTTLPVAFQDNEGSVPNAFIPMTANKIFAKATLKAQKNLLIITYNCMEKSVAATQKARVSALNGSVTYNLPKDEEITFHWKQFVAGSHETQFEVDLQDGSSWGLFTDARSLGDGAYGPDKFAQIRLSKTPHDEVRGSICNKGEDQIYLFRAHNSTTVPVPFTDDFGALPYDLAPMKAGATIMTLYLHAKNNQLVVAYAPAPPEKKE